MPDTRLWRKGIGIRAFAGTPDLAEQGSEFMRSLDDYSRVFSLARSLGFQGVQLYVEIASGFLNLATPEHVLNDIARRARAEGIDVPSIEPAALHYSFTNDSLAERRRGVEVIRRALDVAKALGAPATLVHPGYVGKMWDPKTDQVLYTDAYDRTVAALQELSPHAEKLGLAMLVEPIWTMFMLNPLEMRNIIDQVASPSCGVLVDTGNVLLNGFPEQWIRILGRRVREIHMKDFRRQIGNVGGFVPLLAGDVNWPAVTAAAHAVGFRGFWTAEQFPYTYFGDTNLKHASDAMDRILAQDATGTGESGAGG